MSGPRRTWESVAVVFSRAIHAGAERRSAGHVRWNIAGKCSDPKTVILTASPSEGIRDTRRNRRSRFVTLVPGLTRVTLTVELETRCRRCAWCLRRRASKWRFAARTELQQASGRSWFGTLTFRPEDRYRVLCRASRAAAARGEVLEKLEPLARFAYLANASGELVTKWLKRVRKESGAPLRYLLVVEAHKDGHPHYHVLIHETSLSQPVRKEVLQRQWSHGFSKFNLVKDPATAGYVTKYLSKSLMARVRASVRYGKSRPIAIVAKLRVDPDPKKQLYVALSGVLRSDHGGSVSGSGLPCGPTEPIRVGLSKTLRSVQKARERQRSSAAPTG